MDEQDDVRWLLDISASDDLSSPGCWTIDPALLARSLEDKDSDDDNEDRDAHSDQYYNYGGDEVVVVVHGDDQHYDHNPHGRH
jgi:hypothetical protein